MNVKKLRQLQLLAASIPGSIIAGGAVRDALLGIEGRDIDIYVAAASNAQMEIHIPVVEEVTKRKLYPIFSTEMEYESAFAVFRSKDRKVELVGVPTPTREWVRDTFTDDISMMYVDAAGLHVLAGALTELVTKVVDDRSGTDRHSKLAGKLLPLGFEVRDAS